MSEQDIQASAVKNTRLVMVDAARGVALLLMFAFHFCFDLNYFGLVRFDFYKDPFWLNARIIIVSLFLLLVGVSLFLAHTGGIRWPAVARRTLRIVAAAAVVSVGSYFLFPHSYIFFGVLHFIALASLLGLLFVHSPRVSLLVGAGLLWIGTSFSHPLFDQPMLNWIGLMTYKPITEDYVPLLPWLGVVLMGIWLGSRLYARRDVVSRWQGNSRPASALILAGRHSLLLYLVHQPVFFLLLYLSTQLLK